MREIDSLEQLELFRSNGGKPGGIVFQGLDLRSYLSWFREESLDNTVFLGCQLGQDGLELAVEKGALVFPRLPNLPFNPYRPRLYDAETLYNGFDPANPESYEATNDGLIWTYYENLRKSGPLPIRDSLARRLHDHAITDALEELLQENGGRKVIAIMGGHGMGRADEDYRKVALLARDLCRQGFFLASGGGPGAMEATSLGCWFAPRDDTDLDDAIELLTQEAKFTEERKQEWLAKGMEVRYRWPIPKGRESEAESLGIPTWLYGHEPSNPFATHIAKYFANSVREDGLLQVATYGVIFAPGSAGTIQEVFQDACQNHYAKKNKESPMIFLGNDYWKWRKPVYPLLATLAEGKEYSRWLFITDDIKVIAEKLSAFSAVHQKRTSSSG